MNKQKGIKSDIGSFCGKGVYLEGTLQVEGTIHFNGDFEGRLEVTDTLVVGEKGQIKAEVNAFNLINQGEIIGNITTSNESTLQKGSRVVGDINTARLIIDDGAHFDGNCKMLPAPPKSLKEEKSLPKKTATRIDKPKSNKLKIASLLIVFLLSSATFFIIYDGNNKIINLIFKSSDKYINAGSAYYSKGEINKAVQEFTRALEYDNDNYEGHLGLGNSYTKKTEYNKAIFEYKKLVELEPANSLGYTKLGKIYLLKNNEDEALEAFNQALDFNQSDFEAHNGLGQLFYKNQFYDKATLEFQKSLEIKPGQSFAHRNMGLIFSKLGEKAKAETAFVKTLELDDQDKVAIKMMGELYYKNGKYGKAIPLLKQYLAQDETSPAPLLQLGNAYIIQKRYEEAFQVFKKLLELSPESKEANYNLGELHLKRKELIEAENLFMKLVELDNKNAPGYLGLGKVYESQNNKDKALENYMKAIKVDPMNSEANILIGNLHLQAKSPDSAIINFTEALQTNAKDYRIYFGLCNAYTKKGYFTKAIGLCKNALDLKSDDAFILNRLAWLYAKKVINIEEGIKISLRTIKLMPNTPEFIDTLSELYFINGDRDKAIEAISKAIELAPTSPYYKQQLEKYKNT